MEMTSKANILIMYAKTYDMPAETGRDSMSGCTVHYFFYGENGDAMPVMYEADSEKPIGYQRNKVSLDYATRAKIPVVPGIYEGEFVMTTGGDGKPFLKLTDVQYLEPYTFGPAPEVNTSANTAAKPAASGNGKEAK